MKNRRPAPPRDTREMSPNAAHAESARAIRRALRGSGIATFSGSLIEEAETPAGLAVCLSSLRGDRVPLAPIYFRREYCGAAFFDFDAGRWQSWDSEDWHSPDLAALALYIAGQHALSRAALDAADLTP